MKRVSTFGKLAIALGRFLRRGRSSDLPPSSDPGQEIAAFIRAVRRRLRAEQRWRGVGVGGGIGVGSFTILLIGAALFAGVGWRSLALLLGGGGLGIASVLAIRAGARWRRDDAVARHLGEKVPGIGDDLWSAVELERELPMLEANPLLSPTLVRAHRQRVAERLRAIDPRSLARVRRLGNGWPLLVASAALATLALEWPAGVKRGWAALTSDQPPPSTSSEPIVGDIDLTLQFPTYTELPPRAIPGSSGHVLALPGTRVAIDARALVAGTREASLLLEAEGAEPRELPRRSARRTAGDHHRGAPTRQLALHPRQRHASPAPSPRRIASTSSPIVRRASISMRPADPLEVAGPRRVELRLRASTTTTASAPSSWCGRRARRPSSAGRSTPKRSRARARCSGRDRVGPRRARSEAGGARRLSPRGQGQRHGARAQRRARRKTLTLSMFSPREKQERAMTAEQQLVEEALQLLGRSARGQARQRRAAGRGVHPHPLEGRGAAACRCRAPSSRRARRSQSRASGAKDLQERARRDARAPRQAGARGRADARRAARQAAQDARASARRRGAAAGDGQRSARDRARARRDARSTICSASSGSRSCSRVGDEMAAGARSLEAAHGAIQEDALGRDGAKEIERELQAARAQAGRAGGQGAAARLRAARSVPQQGGDGQERPAEAARRDARDDGARATSTARWPSWRSCRRRSTR